MSGGAAAPGRSAQPVPQPVFQSSPQFAGRASRRGSLFKGVIAAIISAAIVAVVGGGMCFALGVFGNEPLLGNGAGRGDAAIQPGENASENTVAKVVEETVHAKAAQAAREAEEKARAEDAARLAAQVAQRERTALDFATQYYTNGSFVSADDDTQLQPIGNDTWQSLVLQYCEPGSAAVAMFESTFSGPINGLGGFCFVKDARVIESSADSAVVEVRYLATQNPIPGWSSADGYTTVFTCTFAESGLISSYAMS